MTREGKAPTPFGEAVKARFQGRMEALPLDHPARPLHIALYNQHFKIDWTRARPDAEVNRMVGSTAASLHYAHIKTGRPYLQYFGMTDLQQWETVIDNVLADNEMNQIFYENLGRPHTTVTPLRGVPIQYILKDYFGDRSDGLTGIDLGAGVGLALPLLNSQFYKEAEFPNRHLLLSKFGGNINVGIAHGVSVDVQNGREDVDWVKASVWPDAEGVEAYGKIEDLISQVSAEDKSHTFPFITTDVLAEDCFKKIESELRKVNNDKPVDFVLTSYLRYQLGLENSPVQEKLINLIKNLLSEDGVWIDIGEELLKNDGDGTKSKVVVYKKEGDELIRFGVPFILKNQAEIGDVNLEYFHIKKQ